MLELELDPLDVDFAEIVLELIMGEFAVSLSLNKMVLLFGFPLFGWSASVILHSHLAKSFPDIVANEVGLSLLVGSLTFLLEVSIATGFVFNLWFRDSQRVVAPGFAIRFRVGFVVVPVVVFHDQLLLGDLLRVAAEHFGKLQVHHSLLPRNVVLLVFVVGPDMGLLDRSGNSFPLSSSLNFEFDVLVGIQKLVYLQFPSPMLRMSFFDFHFGFRFFCFVPDLNEILQHDLDLVVEIQIVPRMRLALIHSLHWRLFVLLGIVGVLHFRGRGLGLQVLGQVLPPLLLLGFIIGVDLLVGGDPRVFLIDAGVVDKYLVGLQVLADFVDELFDEPPAEQRVDVVLVGPPLVLPVFGFVFHRVVVPEKLTGEMLLALLRFLM